MKKYEGSTTALVADIDCTGEGEELCEEHGVDGYPTLKWGDPNALEDYDGEREYKHLAKFAEENLKPLCSPKNIELCDAEKRAKIESYMKMDAGALEALVNKKEGQFKERGDHYRDAIQKVEDEEEAEDQMGPLEDAWSKEKAEIKDEAYRIMKS